MEEGFLLGPTLFTEYLGHGGHVEASPLGMCPVSGGDGLMFNNVLGSSRQAVLQPGASLQVLSAGSYTV